LHIFTKAIHFIKEYPMKKLALFAATLAVAPSLAFTAPVFADSPGQLQNSENFYKVKNVTQNGAYAKSVSATCGDVIMYRTMIANGEFGALSNVTVKTTLAGATNVSATNAANQTVSTSGSVSVSVDKGNLVYVAGSTKNLKDDNSTVLATLGDTVTTSGVNKGSLAGSTAEYVVFQAKVDCPTTPTTPVTPTTPKTPETPKALGTQAPAVIASTGPASTALSMLGLGSLAAAVTYYVRSRRANILG
jgi:hypothetical protein